MSIELAQISIIFEDYLLGADNIKVEYKIFRPSDVMM